MPSPYQSCSAEEEESGPLTSDSSSHDFCPHRKMLIFHDLHELGAKTILCFFFLNENLRMNYWLEMKVGIQGSTIQINFVCLQCDY